MDAAAAAPAEGEDEEAIDPIACDPKAPQGGFLNFAVRWEQRKFNSIIPSILHICIISNLYYIFFVVELAEEVC